MADIQPARMVNRSIRRVLPRSLLGRSLLMILVPLVLLQAVALQIFYGSHLDVVSRRLSSAVVGEIAYTLELLRRYPEPPITPGFWASQPANSICDMTHRTRRCAHGYAQHQHTRPDGR